MQRVTTIGLELPRKRCGLFVTLPLGHHGPGHPRDLVGKRDGGDLCRPPGQQCREPRPVLSAMDLGITDDSKRASHEQADHGCDGESGARQAEPREQIHGRLLL